MQLIKKNMHKRGSDTFPPLNYSRSTFTQWLLKDHEECFRELPARSEAPNNSGASNYHHQQHHCSTTNNKRRNNNMELIQLLAINALEFTAPVYSFLNKQPTTTTNTQPQSQEQEQSEISESDNKSVDGKLLKKKSSTELSKELKLDREFIQLSGHPGSFAPAGPNSIWKKMPNDSQNEAEVYEYLSNSSSDPLKTIIPSYISRTEWNGSTFIELEDLVTRFNPESVNIMDLKLGTRTFLESEVTNNKPRSDLYTKMQKLDPSAATQSENSTKAVTKLRYMQFRENLSSTKCLGFRIEGIKLSQSNNLDLSGINFPLLRDENRIRKILRSFCGDKFTQKLIELRNALESSSFFKTHEIIGSSLLLIHDNKSAGAWLIDFAKTFQVDGKISHRDQWELGNREDGLLIGVDNIIRFVQ